MADEEFMSEYKLTLSELVTNAKITINVLSMLADENKKFAPQIAEAVEERIRTATPGQKLPALYLIDSIIKNVKDSDYLKIFTKNIVSLFICVFERGDERIRSAMYKLRQTWIELFPNDVLLKLDLAVNSIDPAWPITAVRPVVGQQAVHLNPDFLNKAKEALKGLTSTNSQKGVRQSEMEKLGGDGKEERAVAEVEGSVPVSGGSSAAALGSEAEMLFQKQLMAKQLLAKQQELLQIQQRRVEIELAKAQMQIEQAKQLALQKPKQTQEVSINDAGEDKTPKKSKAKRSRTSSGAEDAEGSKSNEKAPEEPAMTSLLKSKSPIKAAESAKTELGADPRRTLLSAEEPLSVSGVMPEKPQAKKRKSGDAQKVDPRLRKKMMLNKDGASVAVSIAKPPTGAKTAQGTSEKPRVGVEVKAVGTKTENAKVAKEVTLSEDLKDLFGNVDKDFRTQMHSAPKTSLPDTQWKVLKSEGQNVPAYNFAHHKVVGGERRMNVQNRFGPYGKHLGAMHGNRKTLLPTPAPIFGQDLKPRQATVDNFEKLQEMKRELDVEAERLNSLSYDASKNGDFEAFEADVMRGNSLLNKARWNNWRHQERGAKRPRRQAGSEQFHNGPPFGNRPQHRSLLHAPPRVANFSEAQPHRPSPPHPQFPHQPSPPQFCGQPRSPGQGNFGHGHNEYRGDDYNFDHFGGDRYNRETHYRDENCRSLAEGSWGGYQPPNPHNPPPRPSNPIDWRKPGPQQAFSQSSINSTTSVTKGSFGSGHHNNFNVQNNDRAPPGNSQTSENYVHQLFSKLTKFGFLNNIVTSNSKDQEKIPRMSDFDVKQMKIKYRSLIEELSSGTLCRTCGLTFPPTKGVERKKGEEQAKARYLMHLDWHFQVNKKANSIPKAERCREYYPDQDTWYRYEVVNVTRIPIEDVDEGDVKKEDAGSSSVAGKSKCIDAAEDKLESMKEKYKADLSTFVYKNMVKENEKCFICHEGFESYWDDEKEEWGLRDAYMLKEKLFHSSCFLEYEEHDLSIVEQQSSTTPSIPNDSLHSEQDAKEDIENKVEASGGKILVECAVLPDVEADAEEAKVGLEESDDAKCIPDLV